jgi:hypothetical protein
MKTRLFIVLAAVVMLFTACTKEELPREASINQLILDGVKYDIHYPRTIDHGEFYMIDNIPAPGGPEDEHGYFYYVAIEKRSINKTLDLTRLLSDDGYEISLTLRDESIFYQTNIGSVLDGEIDGHGVNGAVFSAGEASAVLNNEGMTFTLRGIFTNGKTISLKTFVEKENILR